jgi:hypothetical protein
VIISNFEILLVPIEGGRGEEEEEHRMRQEATLPMSCYIALEVNTRNVLYPQPVSLAGYK